MVEQNKRELNTQQVVVSSRWNPTPEQLQTLEELYRRGTEHHRPNKSSKSHPSSGDTAGLRAKTSFIGSRITRPENGRNAAVSTKPTPTNNNSPITTTIITIIIGPKMAKSENPQKTTQGATKGADAECKTDGWVQFDDATAEILQQQQRRNATWQMMNLSCSPSPTNLIINSSNNSVTSTSIPSSSTVVTTLMETNRTHDFINIFSEPYTINSQSPGAHCGGPRGGGVDEVAETLQLFPLERRRGDEECAEEEEEEEEEESGADMSTANGVATSTFQFFEFLPLKN
ncbi:hypothetical protein DH2020_013616 [Rehmannia glutinosa]|uniref:Uncharacterized protein n=1 Tax=Rehmannia glutinosa TaxID=99300 RepID=A0ABR0X2R6_REHGL